MRALDLFCGVGGVSRGLTDAGFDVTGVDIIPQPDYPYKFIKADALEVSLDGYDFIWASPPCQAFSWAAAGWYNQKRPQLINPIRMRLQELGVPYIIENVQSYTLLAPIMLCGTQFGLPLIKHRFFESNFTLQPPPHTRHIGKVKAGDYVTTTGHGGDGSGKLSDWQNALQIAWTKDKHALAQALPPVYSKYLVEQCKL